MGDMYDCENLDDIVLPGFRFHPTDEELVGFYLKRKIQQCPFSVELIKQLDIYKYDPWDLPKLAMTGEKEWYFYCPRDRKYRNSARPNRVTEAGFWKATGTDRPVYSSNGTKCIGLKKSLVFYKGRAAKGIKTDWMMHELRLPSLVNPATNKKTLSKNISANESWAICRIFKKTNSVQQRALSHSWMSSSLPETTAYNVPTARNSTYHSESSAENVLSCTTDIQQSSSTSFNPNDTSKPSPLLSFPNANLPDGFMFSTLNMLAPSHSRNDVASTLLNLPPSFLGDIGKISESIDFPTSSSQQQCADFSRTSSQEIQKTMGIREEEPCLNDSDTNCAQNQLENALSFDYSLILPSPMSDAWRPNMFWDSWSSPNELSLGFFH